MKKTLLIGILALVPFMICGCSKSGDYRTVTYMLWADELKESKSNLVDITQLSDKEIDELRKQNHDAKFYWTTSGKRIMEPKGKGNYKGFWERVYLSPFTIVIDGMVLTFFAVINGGR